MNAIEAAIFVNKSIVNLFKQLNTQHLLLNKYNGHIN